MLFINSKENLKKEKTRFFKYHLDFINQHMPEIIRNYVSSFLNDEADLFLEIQNIKLQPYNLQISEIKLFYCIIYVCLREVDIYWKDFFNYIHPLYPSLPIDFTSSFTFNNQPTAESDLYVIRQCRVDKPKYTHNVNVNVGFYNKNDNFSYQCYNDQEAVDYLINYCSPEVLAAYNNIQYPQAKSDFFLMASLYTDGGISADVCSVAQSNIEILIKNTDFLLIFDENGIHKKFIYAHPQNPFILYHLNYLIQKMNHFGADKDYEHFSSQRSFYHNFMDFYAFYYQDIKDIHLTFLHNHIYTAFVRNEIIEENLSCPNDFPFVVAKGAFKSAEISPPTTLDSRIEISKRNFYMPAKNNVVIIGNNNYPHFINRVNSPYSIPSLNVWSINDVSLSGLGWLWKDNQYISFESHLSNLPFDPNWMQNFQKPNSDNITRVIDDECIIVISAGYPCYGHYLVDDIPRIGLIKDYLGDEFYNKKFILSALTPEWAKRMLNFFFGISDEHFLNFHDNQEIWKLKKVFVSSFPSKDNYNFHNYLYDFYKQYHKTNIKPYRLICLSRSLCNPNAKHQRMFESREIFECLALSYGFEVICPETLSIEEQIQLMAETVCMIGEHGSAQHSSVFNPNGMVVGTINPIGDVQLALGRIYNDKNILCYQDEFYWGGLNNEVLYYDIKYEKLIKFFDKIIETLKNHLS